MPFTGEAQDYVPNSYTGYEQYTNFQRVWWSSVLYDLYHIS